MAKKRTTQAYELRDGNEIVYIGEAENLEEREQKHRAAGKKFTSLRKTSPKLTPESAKKREEQSLERYRKRHRGKNPRYNKTDKG